MIDNTYCVLSGELVIARGMSLGIALDLVEALMQKFYADPDLAYTIRREPENDLS